MTQLASDLNNTQFVGATNPDSLLFVQFYMRSEQDNFKSELEGRPIFFEVPYIKIIKPGDPTSEIDTPAREDHKNRFPFHWAQFNNSQNPDDQIIGTPVQHWPILTKSQAEELKAIKFFTVEQIAGASDLQIQRLGMNGPVLKQKAQAFLLAAKDSALEQRQASEIAKKDAELAELRDRVARMEQRFMEKPKRKYTKRNKEEDNAETT